MVGHLESLLQPNSTAAQTTNNATDTFNILITAKFHRH